MKETFLVGEILGVDDFGVRLRKAREKKGLTQEGFGKKIGITHSTISQYENNLRVPSVPTLVKISKVLGVSTDYLLGLNPPYTNYDILDGLTERQRSYVMLLIGEFKETNK